MLLPALGKAREKARNISCTNNLKSIITYDMFYVEDYDGGFIPTTNSFTTINGVSVSGGAVPWRVYLQYAYKLSEKAMICPALKLDTQTDNSRTIGGVVYHNYMGHYISNNCGVGVVDGIRKSPNYPTDQSVLFYPGKGTMKSPSSKIIRADTDFASDGFDLGGYGRLDITRHSGRTNIAFGDAHVSPMEGKGVDQWINRESVLYNAK